MNKTQALHQFWNSFGIDAYEENSVPDDANQIIAVLLPVVLVGAL
mgnify:CR=1 FL=1